MSKIKLSVFILIFSLILGLTPSFIHAEANANGTISGTVVNGTPGGSPVAGITADLYTYENNNYLSVVSTVVADDGSFIFTGISTDSIYQYEAVVTFNQVEYPSDILQFDSSSAETVKNITINVYETTTSDSHIKIGLAHTVISLTDGNLDFTEVNNFENTGDRTYIGAQPAGSSGHYAVLNFTLPPNATNLAPASGLSENYMVKTDNGFVDTSPVAPGTKSAGYNYTVAGAGKTYDYTRTTSYAIDELKILIKGQDIIFSGVGFTQSDTLTMGSVTYSYFYKQNIAAGETIAFKLSGLPSITSNTSTSTTTLLIIIIAVLVVVALVFVLVMQSRKKKPVEDEEE